MYSTLPGKKKALFSILGFGPREFLIFFSKNIKETFEGLKYMKMFKLHQNKNQYKLGVHPVAALKAYILFSIGYIASLTLSKLFQVYKLSKKT